MPDGEVRSPLAPRNGVDASTSRVKFSSESAVPPQSSSGGSGSGSHGSASSKSGGPVGSRSLSASYFHPSNSSFSVLSGSSKMPSHILAEELIMRGAKRKPTIGQTIETFYASITHLHFGNLGIVGDVEPLRLCGNLRVLYVYENRLTSLKGVGALQRLTHLYAHENLIASLEDFEAPASLSQLFLGGNRLSFVEGLEGCTSLTELHLEGQRFSPSPAAITPTLADAENGSGPPGERLESVLACEPNVAEPAEGKGTDGAMAAEGEDGTGVAESSVRYLHSSPPLVVSHASLVAIAPSLLKLNIAHNRIDDDTIEPFVVLQRLTSLDVRANQLESITRLQQLLVRLPELRTLRLAENSLLSVPKARERIVVASIW